jgi:hypothetical protein
MSGKYFYSFCYDATGDGATTIGNQLESDVCLHTRLSDQSASFDERWDEEVELMRLCREQVRAERPGVGRIIVDINGVTEPDGRFYYLPDRVLAQ